MKTVVFLSLWLVAVAATAQTNTCRYPVRIFGNHAVDLSPLFDWWTHQPVTNGYAGAILDQDTNAPDTGRPLAAWHRVTGTHVGNMVDGTWVVDAIVYTAPNSRTNARVILSRPPIGEEQNFVTLKTQLDATNQQITNLRQLRESSMKAQKRDTDLVNQNSRTWSRQALDNVKFYTQKAIQDRNTAIACEEQLPQLETQREQLEALLKNVPIVDGAYHVDWFAVMLGRSKHGLPIYDLGVIGAPR